MVTFGDAFLTGVEEPARLREQRRQRRQAELEDARRNEAFNALAEGNLEQVARFDPRLAGQAQAVEQSATQFQDQQEDRRVQRNQDLALRSAQLFKSNLARGGDPAAAAATLKPVLEKIGAPPEEVEALVGALTQAPELADDIISALGPQRGTPAKLQVGVDPETGEEVLFRQDEAGNPVIVRGILPSGRDDALSDARLRDIESRIGAREEQSQQRQEKADRETIKAARQRKASVSNAFRNARTATRDGQRALDAIAASDVFGVTRNQDGSVTVEPAGVVSAARRNAAARIPGTDEFEIAKDIQSLKDNIGIDSLLNIKREGSGLGQVPQSQLETLQGLLGRLEVGRDPERLYNDIQDAVNLFADIMAQAESEIALADRDLAEANARLGNATEGDGGQTVIPLSDFLGGGQ